MTEKASVIDAVRRFEEKFAYQASLKANKATTLPMRSLGATHGFFASPLIAAAETKVNAVDRPVEDSVNTQGLIFNYLWYPLTGLLMLPLVQAAVTKRAVRAGAKNGPGAVRDAFELTKQHDLSEIVSCNPMKHLGMDPNVFALENLVLDMEEDMDRMFNRP